MSKQNPFINRIVGHGVKPASQFLPHPLNARKHPQRQRDAVNASLTELGWIQTVIENIRTGHTLDGHERIWQALPLDEEVPYTMVDLPEELEPLALAIYDRTGEMAEVDSATLDALLREIDTTNPILTELLAEMANDANLYGQEREEREAPEDFAEYDEELETEYCCPKCGYKWSGKPA